MKKLLLFTGLILYGLSFNSCSRNDDSEYHTQKVFTNSDYIKNQLTGKWKYWGRFYVDRNEWVNMTETIQYSYDFMPDQTFYYENKNTEQKINGTFEIIPGSEKVNPYIVINTDSGSKKLLLLNFNNNYMSIFESPFEERYEKQ